MLFLTTVLAGAQLGGVLGTAVATLVGASEIFGGAIGTVAGAGAGVVAAEAVSEDAEFCV